VYKGSKGMLRDGFQNGREKGTKRKVEKGLERHKAWQQLENNKLKIYSQLMRAQVRNK